MKRSLVRGIGGIALVALALGTTFGLQSHNKAYAASSAPVMQKSNIVVNGKNFSTQYKFVYNGTTYMPIWYIMQALKKSGAQVNWNGHEWTIGVSGSYNPQIWHGFGGNGEVAIYNTSDPSNVQTVETGIIMQVYPDPADGIKTTFFPIYDIQVILRDLGYTTDTWDGTNWSIAMGSGSTGSTSGQGGATNPPLPSGVTQTQYNNDVTQAQQTDANSTSPPTNHSALSSTTQWYNDPSDIFYNKQFPVSELKNGTVLQKNPYVIVSTPDGGNTANSYGGGYVYILEYVGYGPNATGTPSTYWKEAQVYTNTGKMFQVVTSVQSFMVASNSIGGYPDLSKPTNVSGINFGSVPLNNPTWAVGGGTDVIPIQGWNPKG